MGTVLRVFYWPHHPSREGKKETQYCSSLPLAIVFSTGAVLDILGSQTLAGQAGKISEQKLSCISAYSAQGKLFFLMTCLCLVYLYIICDVRVLLLLTYGMPG